jgi:hypothetical protein
MKIFASNNKKRPHIALDPYGNVDYRSADSNTGKSDYTNQMKNKAYQDLYTWAYTNDYPLIFLPFEDSEFFARFPDGVPVYNEQKFIINKYSLVFFDGPHTTKDVMDACRFFIPRLQKGGALVFDDTHQYAHATIHDYVISSGFRVLQQGVRKSSYVKTHE